MFQNNSTSEHPSSCPSFKKRLKNVSARDILKQAFSRLIELLERYRNPAEIVIDVIEPGNIS